MIRAVAVVFVVLGFLEQGQKLIVAPTRISECCPPVEVSAVAGGS